MDYELWPMGDGALLLRLGARAELALNRQTHAWAACLERAKLPAIRSIAPSYAAVLLELNVRSYRERGGRDALRAEISDCLLSCIADETALAPRLVEIPVAYGGESGPDLQDVSMQLRLSCDEVVGLHCSVDYQVAMLGFLPGFPYLLGLPDALQLPRRTQVRPQVPAGSIAIAGAQAGIYPQSSPGGWHLIGRTHTRLFDPLADPPAALAPGDRVRFVRCPPA